jgi:predicted nucleic-acid-binding Zn-ribbon protein
VSAETKCLRCGGTNLEPGALRSTGALHFRPHDAKFLKLKTANVDVDAQLCLDCGTVSLTSDVRKVKSLMGKE